MNELFSNEANRLYFYCRSRGVLVDPEEAPQAKLIFDHVTEKDLDVVRDTQGVYYVVIDSNDVISRFTEVHFLYELEGYGLIIDKQKFEVSRRIVSYDEVLEMLPNITYSQYEELERTVRALIEVFCKQKFNYWYGTRSVRGNEGQINLPQHLDKLDGLSKPVSMLDTFLISSTDDGYEISDDGFSIENARGLELRKSVHGKLKETDFKVMGQWGYVSVPTEVKQAAAALIQQKLCPDSVYRERFVEGIRNEGTNIKFSPATYRASTGNADADQLLSKYRILHVGVV